MASGRFRSIESGVTQPPNSPTPQSGTAGRWYLVFIGLSIALVGGLFVWLMARSFLRAREMRSWPEVPCVILTSEVEERRHDENSLPEFRQNVSFGYEWQGQPRTGDRLTLRGSSWSSKRELAEGRVAAFPEGSSTTCRVSPVDPDFAVLTPDSLAPGYSIWFPSLFVVGGLMISYRAVRGNR
jgi:Protein of unknown function (DUF3592)